MITIWAPVAEAATVYSNPIREALKYQKMIDDGRAASRVDAS